MAKPSFFANEPLYFKLIYVLSFIGALYVLYEILFVDEEEHSGIAIYLLVLYGLFFMRIALKKKEMKRSIEHSNQNKQ